MKVMIRMILIGLLMVSTVAAQAEVELVLDIDGDNEVYPGDRGRYEVTVENKGLFEAEDVYIEVRVDELGFREKELVGEIDPGEVEDVDVRVLYPENAQSGVYTITVQAIHPTGVVTHKERVIVKQREVQEQSYTQEACEYKMSGSENMPFERGPYDVNIIDIDPTDAAFVVNNEETGEIEVGETYTSKHGWYLKVWEIKKNEGQRPVVTFCINTYDEDLVKDEPVTAQEGVTPICEKPEILFEGREKYIHGMILEPTRVTDDEARFVLNGKDIGYIEVGEIEREDNWKVQVIRIDKEEEAVQVCFVIVAPPEPTTIQHQVTSTPFKQDCEGCKQEDSCLPVGTRFVEEGTAKYCDLNKDIQNQKEKGATCQNNYECTTNQCMDGECASLREEIQETRSMLEEIRSWIKGLFGFGRAKSSVEPDFAVTRSPISHLSTFTQTGIQQHARDVCLGGLTAIEGPPILGDSNGRVILSPAQKFGTDLTAQVTNGYLECRVPCTNPHASDIQTAYAFDGHVLPFTLQAAETCAV